MLVIDPDECIDCGGCIPECPVNAIYPEDDLPEDQKQLIEINAALASKWPTITDTKDPLIEADAFKDVKGKFKNLQRSGGPLAGNDAVHNRDLPTFSSLIRVPSRAQASHSSPSAHLGEVVADTVFEGSRKCAERGS